MCSYFAQIGARHLMPCDNIVVRIFSFSQLKMWISSFLNAIAAFFARFGWFSFFPLFFGDSFSVSLFIQSIAFVSSEILYFYFVLFKCKYVNYKILCTGDMVFASSLFSFSFHRWFVLFRKKSQEQNIIHERFS